MDGATATRLMIDNSGMTPSELSNKLHRSRTYINTLRRQESAPSMPTFARLCHETGYRLMLQREDGREIELYSRDDAMAKFFLSVLESDNPDLRSESISKWARSADDNMYSDNILAHEDELKRLFAKTSPRDVSVNDLRERLLALADRLEEEEAFFKKPDNGDSTDSDDS